MMRKFMIRRTAQYFVIMLIPMLLAFVFSSIMVVKQADQELQIKCETTLSDVENSLETVVGSLANLMNRFVNVSMISSLRNLLSNEEYSFGDAVAIRCLKAFMTAVGDAHSYVESVYLYFDGMDRFFSSENTVVDLESSSDQDWVDTYDSMNSDTQILVEQRLFARDSYSDKINILTVYQRMLVWDGVIVININTDDFLERIHHQGDRESQIILLLNEDGSLLLDDCPDDANLQTALTDLLADGEGFLNGKQGGWTRSSDGCLWKIQYSWNDTLHLYQAVVAPASALWEAIQSFLSFFLAFFLAGCAVTILLSWYTTRRNFEQINYMLELFSNAEKGIFPEAHPDASALPKDEYDAIMNNILHLFLNTSYLKTQLAEKQYKQEAAELSVLQYQINPHFLFNTLQTVNLEILKLSGDTRPVLDILKKLTEILKYSLITPMQPVLLREELEYLKDYVSIQQSRTVHPFIVYYEVEDSLLDMYVFRLLLQPLLENSILHGIRELKDTGYIKVRIYRNRGRIRFVVIDNGIGMDKAEVQALYERINGSESSHIGLPNVHRRITMRYGKESGLHILSKKGMGTCMCFSIPADTEGLFFCPESKK
ncbi:MAG TPA: histidine kinase [Candidatus Limivivens intestinipullorum]|uniref:Histidine kinase n=1 Tax=Candidatus Limivivens intestinipullorum TaxID=2840858 RepID=A0A9D1EPT7_9FIRM|nr:histidine kinase [Candidatus Limivivens intestinipullorum]